MTMKLSIETFVAVVRKSGLVDAERLQQAVTRYASSSHGEETAAGLADQLVADNLITRWQAEKLLQGKHRGYFLGKYKLLSLLGKGGMSSVYLAEHLLMRRQCALKVLPAKRVDDSSYLERFHREAQAAASLDHPNIVRAYDVDHEEEGDRQIHFLVMEYVEGTSLQELVPEKGLASILDAAEYARQAAAGLQHAHENGMVHRDIKPGNVLVDLNGVVKILDLGLAKFFKVDEGKHALTLRHDEKVLGTADYLAPEQAIDSHTVDARADLYSLGCTLYFMVTGRPPFTEGTLAQRLLAHQIKTPTPVESLRSELPPSLVAIIQKMMAKNPADRYSTAAEIEHALFNWIHENADPAWRRAHPNPYGSRIAEAAGDSTSALGSPPATPAGNSVAEALSPLSAETPMFHGDNPIAATEASSGRSNEHKDTSLDLFLSTLAQTKREAPVAKPSQPPMSESAIEFPSGDSSPQPDLNRAAVPNDVSITVPEPAKFAFPAPETSTNEIRIETNTRPSPALPNKTGSFSSTSRSTPAVKRQTKRKQIPLIAAATGAGLIVVYLLIGFLTGGKTGDRKTEVAAPFPPDKFEVTVGPRAAEYTSIREALIDIRNRYKPSSPATNTMTIKVAAGTYAERIRMNGQAQAWPEGIRLLGMGDVRLAPSGEDPVIRLANLSRFSIENIQMDAADKKVAVELSDDLHETRLSQIRITGYSEAGIVCKGAQGLGFSNNQLMLDRIQCISVNAQTTAVRIEPGTEHDANNIIIRNCRFLNPMDAGVVIQGSAPYGIEISQCIFNETAEGIRFDGEPQLKLIRISNNTFRKNKVGIAFTKLPHERSSELVFRRNLFVETQQSEGLVKLNFDAARFRSMLSTGQNATQDNWSDRSKPTTAFDGDLGILFEKQGRQGEQNLSFASTDPSNPDFLVPAEKSPNKDIPGAQGIDKKWVGAIGPK